ncbi:uncharacterized protein [Apostichopus japonicus]|uniref:uncharacterized protein n=1 Tax=Stichopus japonicus TaxID=307972 RepID=UPI003AB27849
MTKYLLDQKKIQHPIPEAWKKRKKIPDHFVPTETTCFSCHIPLSKPTLVSNKAKVFSISGINIVSTYVKLCQQCHLPYRYQEVTDGIHNYNDLFLITYEVLNILESSVASHIAIGSQVECFNKAMNINLNTSTVIGAYLHFVGMSQRTYDFTCISCGYYPPLIVMDLDKKGAFHCDSSQMELPEMSPESDVVNAEEFWQNVVRHQVAGGFLKSGTENPFPVIPGYQNWAPYIAPNSRGSVVINTEHRKVSRSTGKLEEEVHNMTEERLIELLYNSTTRTVRELGQGLRITGLSKMAKADIIRHIQNAISSDENKFHKVFKKAWGSSGGWASLVCPHGIVYAIKFVVRAESPRDYVDLLASLKHMPNIVLVDMAHMVANHAKKRFPKMFNPYDGRLAEVTEANLKLAKRKELVVEMPWLHNNFCILQPEDDQHPVTGCNEFYCLYDRFHEKNSSRKCEILRRITNVPQLHGFINTQVVEQLHQQINRNNNFLTQMKPARHIFMFRNLLDLHNKDINRRQIANVEAATGYSVHLNIFGRAMLFGKCETKGRAENITVSSTISSCKTVHGSFEENYDGDSLEDHSDISPSCPFVSRFPPTPSSADRNLNPHQSDLLSGQKETKDSGNECKDPPVIDLTCHPDELQGSDMLSGHKERKNSRKGECKDLPIIDLTCQPDEPSSNRSHLWVPSLHLSNQELEILERQECLTDTIIEAGQSLLKAQFPYVGGLQPPYKALSSSGFDIEPGEFVQIIHLPNHWVTVSTIGCRKSEVKLYDSMIANAYSLSMTQLITSMMMSMDPQITILVMDVTQQQDSRSCGVYALAFASALCLHIEPSTLNFSQSRMYPDLKRCLQEERMTLIGAEKGSNLSKVNKRIVAKIYCTCRGPDVGNTMMQCFICMEWFHEECVGVVPVGKFICRFCRKRKIQKQEDNALAKRQKMEETKQEFINIKQRSGVLKEKQKIAEDFYCYINRVAFGDIFPDPCDKIAVLAKWTWEFHQSRDETIGVTVKDANHPDGFDFILIDGNNIPDNTMLYEVIIHEMVHAFVAMNGCFLAKHGKKFQKLGRECISKLNAVCHDQKLPHGLSNKLIDPHNVLLATRK